MRELQSGKGQSIQTPLSDEEAIACCRRLNSKFIKTLVGKYDHYQRQLSSGTRAWPLSEAQWYWLHKYALEGDTPKIDLDQRTGDFAPIIRLFQGVERHSRFPKVNLLLPANPIKAAGLQQALGLAWASGATARFPGTINVTNAAPFGRVVWYGRIFPGGTFHHSGYCDEHVLYLLRRFAQDPVGTAAEHGRRNGKCCFCDNPLNDPRSARVGYGSVCAVLWNLPFGDNPTPLSVANPGALPATQEPGKPLFDDPRVQAEYERLVSRGVHPAVAQERAFDPLIQEADRLDQERADRAN
jgi:hypothetical protein